MSTTPVCECLRKTITRHPMRYLATIITLGLFAASLITFIITMHLLYQKHGECRSDDCREAARQMSSAIEGAANPCNDFFEFATGRWQKQAQPGESLMKNARDHVKAALFQLHPWPLPAKNDTNQTSNDHTRFVEVDNFYRSCLYAASYWPDNTAAFKRQFKEEIALVSHLGAQFVHIDKLLPRVLCSPKLDGRNASFYFQLIDWQALHTHEYAKWEEKLRTVLESKEVLCPFVDVDDKTLRRFLTDNEGDAGFREFVHFKLFGPKLIHFANYLNPSFVPFHREMMNKTREQFCKERSLDDFYPLFLQEYSKRYNSKLKAINEKTSDIFQRLQNATLRVIKASGKFDKETEQKALKIISTMKMKGMAAEKPEDSQKGPTMSETDFFQNGVVLYQLNRRNSTGTVRSAAEAIMNTAYKRDNNTVKLSIGLSQKPFIWSDEELALGSFARLGSLLASEMMHAFDAFLLVNANTSEHYRLQQLVTRECFIEHYDDYKVNGKLTLRENRANVEGLRVSFKAMHAFVEEFDSPKKLPQLLKYTWQQLFFIAFAQMWQNSVPREDALKQSARSGRTPAFALVNGAVSNTEEFATAFNCKPGTPMSPRHKCSVW